MERREGRASEVAWRWGEVVINRSEQHEELLRIWMKIFVSGNIVAKCCDNWLCWPLSI